VKCQDLRCTEFRKAFDTDTERFMPASPKSDDSHEVQGRNLLMESVRRRRRRRRRKKKKKKTFFTQSIGSKEYDLCEI